MAIDRKHRHHAEVIRTFEAAELPETLRQLLDEISAGDRVVDGTDDGRVVARLTAPPRPIAPEQRRRTDAERASLIRELSELAPEPFDAVEEIREHRRDL